MLPGKPAMRSSPERFDALALYRRRLHPDTTRRGWWRSDPAAPSTGGGWFVTAATPTATSATQDPPLFALDVGTRKVLGLVAVRHGSGLKIVAAAREEHRGRAMMDGQIHDVPAVAGAIKRVKETLEKRTGHSLRHVVAAAAGRALKSERGQAERQLSSFRSVSREDVLTMEYEAVQAAQASLDALIPRRRRQRIAEYLFVAHSATRYEIDGVPVQRLEGQRGWHARVEVIAAFLPRGVIDALTAALELAGLELAGLTLEPMAALKATVPPTMHHLNLALVDVGAGTSDIAVTRAGRITGYEMVPLAGDALTVALSEAHFLDFDVAEQAKRRLQQGETVNVRDVWGQVCALTPEQAVASMAEKVDALALAIAEAIRATNDGPPAAVVMVGGGSLSPGLSERLAAHLDLPPARVAVQQGKTAVRMTGGGRVLAGPAGMTVKGIALLAAEQGMGGMSGIMNVKVDGRAVRMFPLMRPTVADALLAAGIPLSTLSGRIGPGLVVTVNGKLHTVPGTFGRPGRVLRNGEEVALETPIAHGDALSLEPGADGEAPAATVADVLPPESYLHVIVNDRPFAVPPSVSVNGSPAALSQPLADGDRVDARPLRTINELLAYLHQFDEAFTVTDLAKRRLRITVNGEPAGYLTELAGGERVALVWD